MLTELIRLSIPCLVAAALLASASTASAGIKTQTLEYKQGDATLKGFLAYDDAQTGPRPGVIVVHEWYGLNDYAKARAEQLAKLGYVALAADIYGDGKVVATAEEAGKLATRFRSDAALLRSRITAALETLRKNPNVDPSRVAAVGYCFGGTTVLELARSGADLAGVVSFHGGLGPVPMADGSAAEAPASGFRGIRAKVLVCTGADDPMAKPEQVAAFQDEMRRLKADCQVVSYSDAVHGFTNPANEKSTNPAVKYNAAADKLSWERMKQFFAEIFGEAKAK